RRDFAVRRARPDRRPWPGVGGSPPRGAGAPPFFRRTRGWGHTRHGRVLVGGDTVVGRRRGGGPRRVAEGPPPTAWPGGGLPQAESGSASQRRRPGTHARRPHGSPSVVVAGAGRCARGGAASTAGDRRVRTSGRYPNRPGSFRRDAAALRSWPDDHPGGGRAGPAVGRRGGHPVGGGSAARC